MQQLIDHGHSGIGIIVTDHVRNVLAAQSTTRNCFLEPSLAEVMATICAVDLCREMGMFDIILKEEALQIVNAVK